MKIKKSLFERHIRNVSASIFFSFLPLPFGWELMREERERVKERKKEREKQREREINRKERRDIGREGGKKRLLISSKVDFK